MPVTQEQRSRLKAMTRSSYDLRALRIQSGLRLCANFRAKLGQTAGEREEDLEEDAKKVIDQLRSSFRLLTTGIAKNRTLPSREGFAGDQLISEYTELMLVSQYMELERVERQQFGQLEHALDDFPIWHEFLKPTRGIGPALAAIIISELDPHRARYPSSFWKYCFSGGTLISTPSGMKPIESLVVGDTVYDATGRTTDVKERIERDYSGDLVTISMIGSRALSCTAEHPVMVCRDGVTEWIRAEDIKAGDSMVMPRLQTKEAASILPISNVSAKAAGKSPRLVSGIALVPEVAYLLGLFVGDGSAMVWQEGTYQRGRIAISLCEMDDAEKEAVAGKVASAFGSANLNETNEQVAFGRLTLARNFQEWFGHLAQNKKIPQFIMDCGDTSITSGFLRGYFDADGHVVKNGKSANSLLASSASEGLIYQIQLLLTKIGVFAAIHKQTRDGTPAKIRGRVLNQLPDRFMLSIPSSETGKVYPEVGFSGNRIARKVKAVAEGYLLPVKAVVQSSFDGKVFNLRTGSNTYLAQNIAVHNCGLDVAEDGRGARAAKSISSSGHTSTRAVSSRSGTQSHTHRR